MLTDALRRLCLFVCLQEKNHKKYLENICLFEKYTYLCSAKPLLRYNAADLIGFFCTYILLKFNRVDAGSSNARKALQ